jgi:hypothetical protein
MRGKMREAPRFLNAVQVKLDCCTSGVAGHGMAPATWHTGCTRPARTFFGRAAMSQTELHELERAHAHYPGIPADRLAGMIAELSLALLVVGVWLVTCVAG